jgi:outer membrane receptor protein involved in Fe transport
MQQSILWHNPEIRMIMKKHTKLLWLLLPCAVIPFQGAFAQDAEDEQDVFDLSPFVVTGDDDIGYQATNTLAGSRLKTSLRDIGTSISIVNEELLQDTAAKNLEDVLILTPNSEVAGLGGNFSATQYAGSGNVIPEGSRDNPSGGFTRVRGLAAADLTRNLFLTDVPFDSFNTDRIDVQRGPNSALFGLGNPGGIVNATTVRADFLKEHGRVKLETDQYGTQRGSFRYNAIPLEDRLAVFVAGLYDDTEFEQKQAYVKDKRLYLSSLLKVTDNIRVHASVEWGENRSTRPDFIPPNDGITPWILAGKPTVANPEEGAALFRGTGAFFPPTASNSTNSRLLSVSGGTSGFMYFYHDVNSPDPSFLGTPFVRTGRGTPGNVEYMILGIRPMIRTMKLTGGYFPGDTVNPSVPADEAGFWSAGNVDYQILDRSIYDYRKNLFSSASSQGSNHRVMEGSIEGAWLDGKIGFELAGYKQDFSSFGNNSLQGSDQRTIYIDINESLMAQDGSGNWLPNPNFGQPIMSGNYGGNDLFTDRQTLRATVFGEVAADDFLDEDSLISRILGRFRGTGVYTDREIESGQAYDGEGGVNPQQVADALGTGSLFDWNHRGDFRKGQEFTLPHNRGGNFLSITSINDLQGANIGAPPFGRQRDRPVSPATFVGWDSQNSRFKSFETEVYRLRDNDNYWTTFFADKSKTEIESKILLGQWYLWDDSIVLTGSWRNDKASSGSVSAPNITAIDPADGVEKPLNRPRNTRDPAYLAGPKNLSEIADADSKSWSIVVHTPEFIEKHLPYGTQLSVFRSKSDNFQPSSSNVNIFNEPTPPEGGETLEEGFMITTLDGKLSARFNWFETSAVNDRVENSSVNSYAGILVDLVEGTRFQANIDQGFTVADAQAVLPPQGVLDVSGFQPNWAAGTAVEARSSNDTATQDYTAEGMEIEIAYNPTPRWTLLLTVARQETVTSNVYPTVNKFVDDFILPVWVNSNFAQNYILDETTGQTLAERAQNSIVNPAKQAASLAGIPSYEQREWRFNLNTSYNFGRDSDLIPDWLGDFTVGGGIRWQDEMGIGFGVYTDEFGDKAFNPNDAYFAPSQTFVDVFFRSEYQLSERSDLILQLNIKDLTDHDGLYPFLAQPDGSKLYRILEGRLITASATFTF